MDFQQAEQQFTLLEAGKQAGTLDEAAYRDGLNAIRITDSQGRIWAIQECTGQWFVWENARWQMGSPPHRLPAMPASPVPTPGPTAAAQAVPATAAQAWASVPPVAPAPASTVPPTASVAARSSVVPPAVAAPAAAKRSSNASAGATASAPLVQGGNPLGFVFPVVVWAAVFVALFYMAANSAGIDDQGLLVMAGVALVSLLYIVWRLTRTYAGVIERIRVEEVTDTDDDGSTSTSYVKYAYVRTADGKVKRIKSRSSYGKGDTLVKRSGDWNPRKPKA